MRLKEVACDDDHIDAIVRGKSKVDRPFQEQIPFVLPGPRLIPRKLGWGPAEVQIRKVETPEHAPSPRRDSVRPNNTTVLQQMEDFAKRCRIRQESEGLRIAYCFVTGEVQQDKRRIQHQQRCCHHA